MSTFRIGLALGAGGAIALAGVLAAVPWIPHQPVAVTSTADPSVPRTIPALPLFASDVTDDPAGTATALVGDGTGYVAVSAYQNRIREITLGDTDGVLLSPDGTVVAISPDGGTPRILDLRTGQSQPIKGARKGDGVEAWAPGGDRLAVVARTGDIEVVDLATGSRHDAGAPGDRTDDAGNYTTPSTVAAFSPDGATLAVDAGTAIRLVPVAPGSGTPVELPKRDNQVLACATAWSPDGHLVAVYEDNHATATPGSAVARISFVPVTGTAPRPLVLHHTEAGLLGWASATEPVTGEFGLGGPGALVQHRLGSASAVTLASIDADTQYLELATGLVPQLRARGGEYDDGPVPRGFLAGLSVGLAAIPLLFGGIAILIGWLVRRHRAIRRAAVTPAFPAPGWPSSGWQAPPPESPAPVPSSLGEWRSPG